MCVVQNTTAFRAERAYRKRLNSLLSGMFRGNSDRHGNYKIFISRAISTTPSERRPAHGQQQTPGCRVCETYPFFGQGSQRRFFCVSTFIFWAFDFEYLHEFTKPGRLACEPRRRTEEERAEFSVADTT